MRTTNAKLCTAWPADHRIDAYFFFLSRFLFSFFLFQLLFTLFSVLDSLFFLFYFIFFSFLCVCCLTKIETTRLDFDIDAIPSRCSIPWHDFVDTTLFRSGNSSLFFYFCTVCVYFNNVIIGLLWRERRHDQHSPVQSPPPRNIDICIYCNRSSVDRTGRALN